MGRLEVDSALVWQARLGMEPAWNKLVEDFGPVFRRMVYKYDMEERDDLLQEGYLALVESVKDWDGKKDFAGMVVKTAGRKMSVWVYEKNLIRIPERTYRRTMKIAAIAFEEKCSLAMAVQKFNANTNDKDRIQYETVVQTLVAIQHNKSLRGSHYE